MANIFNYSHYHKYLADLVRTPQASTTVTELAKAAAVQRPYMSNVLAARAQLSREQGYRLCLFLRLKESESEYFLNLIEWERSVSDSYRAFLSEKIKVSRDQAIKLENTLERKVPELEIQISAEYFSTWEYCALHVLSSIPAFQSLKQMSKALQIRPRLAQEYLSKLVAWGLVRTEKDRFKWNAGNIHVPAHSPITLLHHRSWREKALENSKYRQDDSVHFTSVYSLDSKDVVQVQNQIREFLKAYSQLASTSKEECLVCFNLDFFEVARD